MITTGLSIDSLRSSFVPAGAILGVTTASAASARSRIRCKSHASLSSFVRFRRLALTKDHHIVHLIHFGKVFGIKVSLLKIRWRLTVLLALNASMRADTLNPKHVSHWL